MCMGGRSSETPYSSELKDTVVLTIQSCDGHVMSDPENSRFTIENQILRMIIDELSLEYFYVPGHEIIIVKIYKDTLEKTPVLREW